MFYHKPIIRVVQISAPPLSANFSPPPISIVPPRRDAEDEVAVNSMDAGRGTVGCIDVSADA